MSVRKPRASGKVLNDDRGFSLIEVLIAISIFSIGFMALMATVWSATSSTRTTVFSDHSVMEGQNSLELLSAIPIDDNRLDSGKHEISSSNGMLEVEWEVTDVSNDFKTIAVKVYRDGELKMRNYYRRPSNN